MALRQSLIEGGFDASEDDPFYPDGAAELGDGSVFLRIGMGQFLG